VPKYTTEMTIEHPVKATRREINEAVDCWQAMTKAITAAKKKEGFEGVEVEDVTFRVLEMVEVQGGLF